MLPTTGCSHCLKLNVFSGCCFCDYVSDHVQGLAQVNALRKKNKKLYIDLMKEAFIISKGESPTARVSEVLTAYDSLDIKEMPDELCNELFSKGLFKNKPFQMEFETRASSVTEERLLVWKKIVPVRRVIVRMGVELSDNWLRNHWLNKNVSNKQIEVAVNLIHKVGWKANANLILGIPGLTEEQSIKLFIESVLWSYNIGFDTIVFSYLNHVPYSLQNYIHKNMQENEKLKEIGIARNIHTAHMSFYAWFHIFEEVIKKEPGAVSKIGFSVFNNFTKDKELIEYYKKIGEWETIEEGINKLLEFNQKRDIQIILDYKKRLEKGKLYELYCETLEEQKNAGTISQTLKTIAYELSFQLWPQQADSQYAIFEEEIKQYKRK